jgi:hypothetical protein
MSFCKAISILNHTSTSIERQGLTGNCTLNVTSSIVSQAERSRSLSSLNKIAIKSAILIHMIFILNKKITKSIFEVILLAILFILQPVHLSAQSEIPDSLINERIQCIERMLDHGKTNINRWRYGWLGGYSVSTVGQGAVCLLSKDFGTRQDMALGASSTVLGAAGQLLFPLIPCHKAELFAPVSDSSKEVRLKKLAEYEELLKEIARREKSGVSWQTHVLYTSANLGFGLITWLGFKRSVWEGVGNFALNTIITETQIWTQPTQAMKDYQEYCRKYKYGINATAYKPKLTCYLSVFPGGIALKISF